MQNLIEELLNLKQFRGRQQEAGYYTFSGHTILNHSCTSLKKSKFFNRNTSSFIPQLQNNKPIKTLQRDYPINTRPSSSYVKPVGLHQKIES